MNLSKFEINKIAKIYGIGKVKSVKLFKGGAISHNFLFQTEKGSFVVRVLGYELTDYWKGQKELEFMVLDFLIKRKFSYEVPRFLKDKNGNCISKVNGRLIEVYPLLKGKHAKKFDEKHIREVARTLACYHRTISKLRVLKRFNKIDNYKWLTRELNEMKNVKPKNAFDKLMLREIGKHISVLERPLRTDIKKFLVCHHDFHRTNLLFVKGKLTGILDFENIRYSPRVCDFYFDENNLQNSLIFIEEYNKHNKLTKKEIKSFITLKLLGDCYSFRWTYRGKMKNEKRRIPHMRYLAKRYKKYIEFEEILKKKYGI